MNLTDYPAEAMKTAASITGGNGVSADLIHALQGLCAESAKLLDAKTGAEMLEELGDLLWYCALIDKDTRGELFTRYLAGERDDDSVTPYDIVVAALRLQGVVKATYADGRPEPMMRPGIWHEAHKILSAIDAIAERLGLSLGDVVELNLYKLTLRHPARFGLPADLPRSRAAERALFQARESALPVIREATAWWLCRENEVDAVRDWLGSDAWTARLPLNDERQPDYWLVYTLPYPAPEAAA